MRRYENKIPTLFCRFAEIITILQHEGVKRVNGDKEKNCRKRKGGTRDVLDFTRKKLRMKWVSVGKQ